MTSNNPNITRHGNLQSIGALVGKLYPSHKIQTKNPVETTGNRYKIEILMSRTQKLKGLVAVSLRLKTLDEYP